MHLNAHLDVDVVAHESASTLSVLLEIAAPAAAPDTTRLPGTLQIVLDRSGSMAGPPLEGAKRALLDVVDRLDPQDRFGVVVFDGEARIVVPTGPLSDKAGARAAIRAIRPGGTTDLAAGYLTGIMEAQRAASPAGATLVLVSDGHANSGETRREVLGKVAGTAHANGVTTTTVGYGLGYDEQLLAALARGGAGRERFVEDPDAAAAAIIGEVDGVLNQAALAVRLVVAMDEHVQGVELLNDYPVHVVDGALQVEIGGLYQGETRKIVLTFDIPAMPALGLAQVATLTLRYVALPDLVQQSVTVPVHVNVVPADLADGIVPDPVVRTEVAFQQVQRLTREASERLSDEDVDGAMAAIAAATGAITSAFALAPPELAADLDAARASLAELRSRIEAGEIGWAARSGSAQATRLSRERG